MRWLHGMTDSRGYETEKTPGESEDRETWHTAIHGFSGVYLATEQELQQIRHMDGNKSISLIQISLSKFSLSFLFPFGTFNPNLPANLRKMPETVIFPNSALF